MSHEDFVHLLVQGKDLQETNNNLKIEKATQEIVDIYQYIDKYIEQKISQVKEIS